MGLVFGMLVPQLLVLHGVVVVVVVGACSTFRRRGLAEARCSWLEWVVKSEPLTRCMS